MRRRYVYRDGKLVEIPLSGGSAGVQIMGDIQPYKSMITGEIIGSRSKHRQHLKDHGCVEVGNETSTLMNAYKNIDQSKLNRSRKELIREQIMSMPHKEFKAMLRRDVQRVRDRGG